MLAVLASASFASSVAIVGSSARLADARSGLVATGLFSVVDTYNTSSGRTLPAVSALAAYDGVLAFTDTLSASGLTNLLASYFSLGNKHLTIASYAFSSPYAISGGAMSGDYAALQNVGVKGIASGAFQPVLASHSLFTGIYPDGEQYGVALDFARFTYFTNTNTARPALAPGSTLLATDGAGTNLLARSANGVFNVNLYPGYFRVNGNSDEVFKLMGNTLLYVEPVPEPATVAMCGGAFVLLVALRRSGLRPGRK